MSFNPRHWDLMVAPAVVALACTPTIPLDDAGADTTETSETLGEGDGDAGDGDGDPSTDDGDDDHGGCTNNSDCPGKQICEVDVCIDPEPLGDCSGDSQCPGGICEDYACVPVDGLPPCDEPEGLVELPIPGGPSGLPLQLALGDVDGDGDDDILIATSAGLVVMLDEQIVSAPLGPWEPEGMTGIEIDGDGKLDLAVFHAGVLRLYAGDGTGNFVALGTLAHEFDSIDELARLDADGDGDDDLLVDGHALGLGSTIRVLLNEDGVLVPMPVIDAGRNKLAIGDWGNDGRDEFISADAPWPLRFFWYDPPWTNVVLDTEAHSWGYQGLTPVRRPGSNHLGLLGTLDRYDTKLLYSWGGDKPWPTTRNGEPLRLPSTTPLLIAGDFDGDGYSTAFAYGSDGFALLIHLGASTSEHCYSWLSAKGHKVDRAAIGDLDGDGDDELVTVVGWGLHVFDAP